MKTLKFQLKLFARSKKSLLKHFSTRNFKFIDGEVLMLNFAVNSFCVPKTIYGFHLEKLLFPKEKSQICTLKLIMKIYRALNTLDMNSRYAAASCNIKRFNAVRRTRPSDSP